MHRLQVLLDGTGWYWMVLDGTQGEPPLFPQGCYQAEQVDTQPRFPQDHPGQVRLRCPGPLTHGASPGDEDVLGDCYRNHWDINYLSGPLPPARLAPHSGQEETRCSARWVGVMRGRAKPWGLGFLGLSLRGRRWPERGLIPGIPRGPPGLAFPSRISIRRCNWAATASCPWTIACCWAMTASKTSREAALRSKLVSTQSI